MANPIPGWQGSYYDAQGKEDLTHAGRPASWGKLRINGILMPGVVFVDSVKHNIVKFSGKASGKTPGAPTPRGRDPGTARITLQLLNNREWDEYVALMPRLLPYVKKGSAATAGAVRIEHPLLAAHHLAWVLIESVVATGPKGGGPAVIVILVEESEEATDIKVVQAKPKPRNLGYAPTISLAGEAPVAPSLKAFARTPAQAAR